MSKTAEILTSVCKGLALIPVLIVVVLCLMLFGCDLDTGPTIDVSIVGERTTSETDIDTENDSENTDAGGGSNVSITVSGSTDAGKDIYKLGPGSAFSREGGHALIVWCRPDTNCDGEGVNRTSHTVNSPPQEWAAGGYAYFRLGEGTEVSEGKTVRFVVDGQTVTHIF